MDSFIGVFGEGIEEVFDPHLAMLLGYYWLSVLGSLLAVFRTRTGVSNIPGK